MQRLINKRIILGVTGGIAAYKAAELIRQLREHGATVQVVMTRDAQAFITPLTLQALSGRPVCTELLDLSAEAAMSHIALARWADFIVIAPATANFMARLSAGVADDLLTTLCLASKAPVAIAPAMNQQMWKHSATQHNRQALQERGILIWGPDEGEQACGDVGPGRMMEPSQLARLIANHFILHPLTGKNIVITAGPTQERIDAVRFISNYSSGKMGYALAEAACDVGAKVTLISGPVALTCSDRLQRINVISAQDMLNAVHSHIVSCDVMIATAAVTDFRIDNIAMHKIKKEHLPESLALIKNKDIVATVAQLPKKPFIVGFAAETENVKKHAKQKLTQKNIDMIFANLINQPGTGFGSEDNEGVALWKQGEKHFARMPKKQLAIELINLIGEQL